MNALARLECWGPRSRFCSFLPALASLAAPYVAGAMNGSDGSQSPGGGGTGPQTAPPPSQMQQQDQDTSVDTSVVVSTNVYGAPVNINIGGTQEPDGSFGGGRYFDQGVNAQGLNAPFGTMSGLLESQDVQWGGWMAPNRPLESLGAPGDGMPVSVMIGGVLIVGAIGFALIKRAKLGR